jgi:hypothetical protein
MKRRRAVGVRVWVGGLISRLEPEISSGLDEKVESGA